MTSVDQAPSNTTPPTALVLTNNLLISSQIAGAAQAAGWKAVLLLDVEALRASATQELGALVLLDLDTPRLDSSELVPWLRTSMAPCAIVAFGPHVHADRLATAARAGCDRVLARGQFLAQLSQLFRNEADSAAAACAPAAPTN